MMAIAIGHGHAEQVQHIQDAFARLSYLGVNENLFAALRAFNAGDMQSAAAYLDRSHSFFPDFATGRYSIDNQGNLWVQRYGEASKQPIGPPIQITAQKIMDQMQFTSDPEKYMKVVSDQQKANSVTELNRAHANYWNGFNDTKKAIAAGTEATNLAGHLIAERGGTT